MSSVSRRSHAANQTANEESADLRVRFGRQGHQDFASADLQDGAVVQELVERCNNAHVEPMFLVRNLLGWSDELRWLLLHLLHQIARRFQIRSPRNGSELFSDAFAFILSLVEGPANPVRCERSRKAVIEAIAMFHADNLNAACNSLAARLRQVGVRGSSVPSLMKEVRALIGEPTAKLDPTMDAKLYVEHLAQAQGLAAGDPVLRFYHDDFYEWERPTWKCRAKGEFPAIVTAYLQQSHTRGITRSHVGNVIQNLEGIGYGLPWDAGIEVDPKNWTSG